MNSVRIWLISGIAFLALLAFAGYRAYEYKSDTASQIKAQSERITSLETDLAQARKEASDMAAFLESERGKNEELNRSLNEQQNLNTGLAQALTAEQNRQNAYQAQLEQMSGAIGTLQKLSATDQELLKKYSKVYFLNENYIPSRFATTSPEFWLAPNKPQIVHASVLPFLDRLLRTAAQEGISLRIVSAYRSFDEQIAVKTGYRVTYGAGTANQFSADQGYSEHQLGTTIDLTTPELKILSVKFENTPAYRWLGENAHRFGFILSYPKNNAYYQFEPWHWRFVGTSLAGKLHQENKHFYDLDQREISAHLISIFD